MRRTAKPAVLSVKEDVSPSAVAIQNKRSETCRYCPESSGPVARAFNKHRNAAKNKGYEWDVAGNAQHTSNITGRAGVTL